MYPHPPVPWAKLKRETDVGPPVYWLSLVDHCADVAAMFHAISGVPAVGERLAALGGAPMSACTRARLAAYAALHDFGKANAGFQARWNAGAPPVGHCTEALITLMPDGIPAAICGVLPFQIMQGWGAFDDAILVALGHHGRPLDPMPAGRQAIRHWAATGGYDPVQALAPLGLAVKDWFPEAFEIGAPSLPDQPAFWHAFSGLLTLADWIASDESFFPLLPLFSGGDAERRMAESREKASWILEQIGFNPWRPRASLRTPVGFGSVSPFPARPIQQAAGECGEDAQVVVLESETGSGKTEAALYRFARLFAAGRVDGLYFALPTRVAATSLHGRVVSAVERLFPDPVSRPSVVLAVPGIAPTENTGEIAVEQPAGGIDHWEAAPSEQNRAALWAAERPKKFLAGTIAVGTIDQALLGIVRVKHAHLRLASLSRLLLVVDEVHASDRYMGELLAALLRFHRAAGGHALLLSATLGASARCALLGATEVPPLADAISAPYPALSSDRNWVPQGHPWDGLPKRVRLSLSDKIANAKAIALTALEAAAKGAKVLVIRNLRRDAVSVFNAIMDLDPSAKLVFRCRGVPTLHHGRFAREDRSLLDASVEQAIGKTRPAGGLVLVGTQTLEQSLDIDGDFLITDLAPADVLLQRLGRLHRHMERADRPDGFEQPSALVLAPAAMDSLLGRGAHGMGGDANPYHDLVGIEATRRLIATHPEWHVPAMNRGLVEAATHPEARRALVDGLVPENSAWREADERSAGKDFAMVGAGGRARLDTSIHFHSSEIVFPSDEVFGSRLGVRDVALQLPGPEPGPFGAPIRNLTIPQYWLVRAGLDGEPKAEIAGRGPDGIQFAFAGADFQYDARGLARIWT